MSFLYKSATRPALPEIIQSIASKGAKWQKLSQENSKEKIKGEKKGLS